MARLTNLNSHNTMKKKLLVALTAVIAGLFVFTGCQKDRPYTSYEIVATFPDLPKGNKDPNTGQITYTDAEKDHIAVANYLAGWLIDNRYIMNKNLGNPIVMEGDDLTGQDRKAYPLYLNKRNELNNVDLNEIVVEGQELQYEDKKLVLTTHGAVSFKYSIVGITTMPDDSKSQEYSVNYGPLASNPE